MKLRYDEVESPIGAITLVANETALCTLGFADFRERTMKLLRARFGSVELQREANPDGYGECVRAYLAGELDALDGIPVQTGGTEFQQSVWQALRAIPVGTTISYGELGARLGRPTAMRAVGAANGKNPVALVLPCHRVIGADGSLTGYASGIHRKRWLLRHEGAEI